jgi:hypothetical protein
MSRPKYIKRLDEHHIAAPLVREFLSKGLNRAAIKAIDTELEKLETNATVLRNVARELIIEEESTTHVVKEERCETTDS